MSPTGPDSRELASASTWLARRPGPMQLMDDALLLLRRASLPQLIRGWTACAPLAALVLSLYYLERIEGMRAPLRLYAVALVLAFAVRFALLARLAREFVQAAQPTLPLAAAEPGLARVASSAAVAGFGLWLWAWPFLVLGRISVFAVLAVVPLLALRGAIAPSLLARCACAPEGGFAALLRAIEDNRGARAIMLGLELALSLSLLVLFVNLYALGALVLLLANSVLGLDVAFLAAFLAPDNEFMLLLLLGLSWLALEPLRAAVSALAFTEARGRNEGADLHAAIDALSADADKRSPRNGLHSAALLLILIGAGAAPVRAEPTAVEPSQDEGVREHVQQILQRGEFHEWGGEQTDRSAISELIDRLFGRRSEPERSLPSSPRFAVHVPAPLVVALAVALLVLVVVFVSREARRGQRQAVLAADGGKDAPQPSASRIPAALDAIGQAAHLARAAEYDAAVRLLYAATLTLLARAHVLRLDASQTNGQYLRALPAGPTREQLALFTQLFERTWYGKEPASLADYEQAQRCVEHVRAATERAS